jgi:hypothetical protein
MAGNIFDQFDQQAQPAAAPAGNVFDQFDQVASLNPTQDAGRFASPGLPQEMPAGAPPPQQPGRRQAEMRSYEPTWREQIAQYMMGDQRASPEKQRLVGGLMGTTGLPGSEQMGVVDVTPARIPMFAQEAKRSYDEGNYGKAALNAVGATPAPILGKAVEGVVGGASKAINAFRGEPVRQIAGAVDDVAREAPKAARARMSPAELKEASRAAYKEADEAGVIFTPAGVSRVSREVKEAATEFGFDPILHPQFARALERLDDVASGNVTFKGMDVLRKVAKASASSIKAEERSLGMMMIDKIDDLMENSKTFEALTGNTAQAADAMKRARDFWGRARRTELIEESIVKAERRAGSTGSGGNIDNATRQNLRAILDNPKKARMFTKAEQKQIEQVVIGTKGLNTLRRLGKLSPEGNGLMLALHITSGMAAAASNPLMAAGAASAALGGAAAKRLADRGTNKAVNRLLDDVSSGAKRGPKRNALGPR